jgi:hypothetical protein
VRNLKKHLEKIYRKVALKLVEADYVAEMAGKDAATGDAGRIELYSKKDLSVGEWHMHKFLYELHKLGRGEKG